MRQTCFEISLILQTMHDRASDLAREKAIKVAPSECLKALEDFVVSNEDECQSIWDEGVEMAMGNKLARVKNKIHSKVKHERNRKLIMLLITKLESHGMGLNLDEDSIYNSQKDKLSEAMKYCSDEKIHNMKNDYLEKSKIFASNKIFTSCFARSKKLKQFGIDFESLDRLYLPLIDQQLEKELLKIKKRIVMYWKNG